MHLTPPLRGFPLEICNGDRAQKTRMMPLPNRPKTISIVCNTTRCLFLQLTILAQFSRHEAEDQVTTRCIKCRMPGQTFTNTLSSRHLYVCGMHYHHRWSSLGHFPPSKQTSMITTATEPHHVTIDYQCVILDHRGLHFTGRWRWRRPR